MVFVVLKQGWQPPSRPGMAMQATGPSRGPIQSGYQVSIYLFFVHSCIDFFHVYIDFWLIVLWIWLVYCWGVFIWLVYSWLFFVCDWYSWFSLNLNLIGLWIIFFVFDWFIFNHYLYLIGFMVGWSLRRRAAAGTPASQRCRRRHVG